MIEELLEEAVDFAKEHWKAIVIFLILLFTGVAAVLYQTIDELEQTQEKVKEDSTKGIVETFTDVGKQTSDNMDPGTRTIYQVLWWFLGVMFIIIIVLAIINAFKPVFEALNPWNIAKSFK